jgi:hypothetical protein
MALSLCFYVKAGVNLAPFPSVPFIELSAIPLRPLYRPLYRYDEVLWVAGNDESWWAGHWILLKSIGWRNLSPGCFEINRN